MFRDKADLEQLLEKLVTYKDKDQIPFLEKYNQNWISEILGDVNEIKLIEKKLQEFEIKGLDVYCFIRVFLNILPHIEEETLYLTIALVELFRSICETYNLENYARPVEIWNYIIEVKFYFF